MLPSSFYIASFSLSIFASLINISLGSIIILIVVINRQCRTITNTMMCNTALATMIYSILQLVSASYGLKEDWLQEQPMCVLRAYCYVAVCIAVSGSYALQSISRLFFAVLYKHKSLLSCHIHWFMIIVNYLVASIGPIPPIFIGYGYGLEQESHLCMATTQVFYSSMLAVATAYLVPISIVITVYGIIFYHVRQSTGRVKALRSNNICDGLADSSPRPNLKREMILMRNILILVGIHVCAGIPYLTLVIWHVTQKQAPPEPIYLWAMITISVFFCN